MENRTNPDKCSCEVRRLNLTLVLIADIIINLVVPWVCCHLTSETLLGNLCNRPFPSSRVLFQSESMCETKMTLICMKMKLHAKLIYI